MAQGAGLIRGYVSEKLRAILAEEFVAPKEGPIPAEIMRLHERSKKLDRKKAAIAARAKELGYSVYSNGNPYRLQSTRERARQAFDARRERRRAAVRTLERDVRLGILGFTTIQVKEALQNFVQALETI